MLSELVKTYIADRETVKLEKHDKDTTSKQEQLSDPERSEYKANQQAIRKKINESFKPVNWLTDAAKRASQIQLATHAPKFIHSDAKSSSVNAAGMKGVVGAVGTHAISKPTIDVTGNAAALDVANFLLLSNDTETLWQQLARNNPEALREFTSSDKQLAEWVEGLTAAFKGSDFFSHSLSKQIYFPVADGDYHLVTPLFPTSLCHEVYGLTQHARFHEESKSARASRKSNTPCNDDVVNYIGMAEMSFGGSKPQNISLLNSQRRGLAYLLCSAPPTWRQTVSLPTKGKAALWRNYRWRVRGRIKALNQFLDKVEKYNNTNIRRARAQMVTGLLEEWLTLVATVRQVGNPGWSVECDLPLHEQCLLDPNRRDEDESSLFNNMMDSGEWRKLVADSYGQWLNKALSNKKRDLGDVESDKWSTELNDVLSRMRNDLESYL